MKDKKHLSDVVEKAMKDDHHGPSPWAQQSGVKIVINLGGPPPMPHPMPIEHKAKKVEGKKVKVIKKPKKALGPMESALSKAY
tara:strand:+ start:1030 stop:1278 length:249 start_codon:yes stop_codon:yes gene_type:complete